MENTNTNNFDDNYVRMKDGSYRSKEELIKDSNTVKIDPNQGAFGTAVDQLGNDLSTIGGGLLGLAGNDSALKRSQSSMLANQYIDSQKDYGDFSGKGLLNLGVRNIPLMLGSLGLGTVAKTGTKAIVEGLLKKEMSALAEKTAFNSGLGLAGGLQNTGQLNADNYNSTGKQLSDGQALTSFGSGAVLNAIEGNALLGKLGTMKNVNGLDFLGRGGNALRTGASAGGINVAQDAINRGTVDRSLADGDAASSYAHSFLTGAVLGAPFGAVQGGFRKRGTDIAPDVAPEVTTNPEQTTADSQFNQVDSPLLQLGYDPNVSRPPMYASENGIIGDDINSVDNQRINDYLASGNKDINNVQPQKNSLLQLGYDPNAGRSPMYASDNGIVGNDINSVSNTAFSNKFAPESITPERVDANNVQPQQNSLLQLGYDPNSGRSPMYASDNGIVGNDINNVSNTAFSNKFAPENINPERVDANNVQPQENTMLQLGYDPNAGRPPMYASENGVVGKDINNVSETAFSNKFAPESLNKAIENNSPKSREELLKRLRDKDALKNNQQNTDIIVDNTIPIENTKKPVTGLEKLLQDKYGTTDSNIIELKKRQEKLLKSKNPSFEEDIQSITGDKTLFKDGFIKFDNSNLNKPVEIAIKNVANDIRTGDAIVKVDTNPIVLNDTIKSMATSKIKTPKVKKEFVKLNEKILENPTPEKIKLLNNVKNELEVSNLSDSTKLINTMSKVADNLTEKTAKSINDSFSNKTVDNNYVSELSNVAEKVEIDPKVEQYNKVINDENTSFNKYNEVFDATNPVIDANGMEKFTVKDGNSTLEKVVDRNDNTTQFYRDGQLHNEFGPALIEGKTKEYYLYDEKLSKKEWREQANEIQKSKIELDAIKKNETESKITNENNSQSLNDVNTDTLPKNTKLKGNILSETLKDLINNNLLSDAVEVKKQNISLPKLEQARIDSLNNSIKGVKDRVNVDIEVISPMHDIGAELGEQVYGWFDSDKNKIYIVGHNNIKETLATVLRHELYHKGISVYLKGVDKQVFTQELDKLYQNSLIQKMTDNIMNDPLYTKDKYGAIEESLSQIVENENNLIQNPTMFNRVFDYFKNFLNKVLGYESFKNNKDVRDFLNKTQKLVLTPEETQAVRGNIENVIRFSKEIKSDDKTRASLADEFRNKKYNNQVDRENMGIAGRLFEDSRNALNSENDNNLNPYANPFGTKYFSNKFNGSMNKLMQWTMKQDHLLGFHGKVGQSLMNIINSVNTFKGDVTSRLESESSNLFKYEKLINDLEKGKIYEVLGKYSNEIENSKDSRAIGQRLDSVTLERELKTQGFTGQKLKDAINFSNEFRNVADYAIHISKMNDSIAIWETIKKNINGYNENIGDQIDTIILQSFKNRFEKNGEKLTPDILSIRNFDENFTKVIDQSNVLKDIQETINQKTLEIENSRSAELSQDVSNKTKGEYAIFERDINIDHDAKLNSIPEKQHLENFEFVINKLKEFQDEAISREDKGYIHKDMSGDYFLTVKIMINGKEVKYTLASNDANEISKISKQIKDQFGNDVTVNSGKRETMNSKDLVQSLLSLEAYGGELTTDQINLLSVLEGYGDKIKRQYSGPGYEQNLVKVLADYTYNKINQMSSKHKMGDISMLLNSIDGSNKVSIKAHLTDILQTMTENRTIPTDTVGSKIRGVTSIWALGANISNTLAQVFQTGMIAPNYFRQYTHDTTWLASLKNAQDYLKSNTTGDKGLDSVLNRLKNNDLLTSSMAKSMFEIKDNPFGKSTLDKVKEKAYFLNEWTEKRLRYATVMESYNIYKAEEVKKNSGKQFNEEVLGQSIDNFILNSIRYVNGDFSKQNRAKLYQNDLVATLMMFQDWKSVTFNAFRKMDKQSQIRFALQHSVLMGGVLGVPFADDLMELTDAFFRFFGVQPPAKKYLEKFANVLDENVINGAGDYFKHGIPLIGEKIGLGQLIPNFKGATELLSGDLNKGVKGLLGPSGSLITNIAGGVQQVGRGIGDLVESGGSRGYENVGRGFVNMSPGVLKSFEKGLEVSATGQLQSADGSVKMYDVNRLWGLIVAGNFRTPGMADTLDEYNVLSEYKKTNEIKMKDYKDAYLYYYRNKNFKGMADITQLAKSINPSFDGKNVIKNDKTSISMKDRFLKTIPKDSQQDYKNLL